MTRKDYVRIAAALKPLMEATPSNIDDPGWHRGVSACVHALSRTLTLDNPRFDCVRFLRACGAIA